jgi:hypothetical protein
VVTHMPVPEQWVIHTMNEMEVAELIERHIEFFDHKGRSVHCPTPFVRHYMQRDDGALPTIVTVATLPIVLADGVILAMYDGLDRDRGIVFKIPKQLIDMLPARADCTKEAVGRAMRFLTDDWLCDVACDHTGKCTLIALALTLIERSILDQRPVFFVNAGQRGSGKTTTLTMLIEAVTGIVPAAAAWSSNEEERRKAVFSYFLAGLNYILWDNIPRGTQISCQHIEKSCTSAYYSDRRLGVSEMVATAASTIHLFTGNNVAPKGDLASRALQVRLDVDRVDPENRDFRHPDPVGWTRANRAEILAAFYTILLGNPTLELPRDARMKTRFKLWYRAVGSAVEYAAQCAASLDADAGHLPKQPIDFGVLFLDQEGEDEDATSLAEMLAALSKLMTSRDTTRGASEDTEEWTSQDTTEGRSQDTAQVQSTQLFKAAYVANAINSSWANESALVVRRFLFPGESSGTPTSSRSVGKLLKKHTGQPVKHGKQTLVLKSCMDKHEGALEFQIDVIQPVLYDW